MIGRLVARELRRGLSGPAWLPPAFFLLIATIMIPSKATIRGFAQNSGRKRLRYRARTTDSTALAGRTARPEAHHQREAPGGDPRE